MLVGQAVDLVRNEWLEGTWASSFNQLAEPIDQNVTSIPLKYAVGGPSEGGFLAMDDELSIVLEVSSDLRTVEVIRGVRGTPRQAHGDGALIEPNPRFWRGLIRTAMYQEIVSWPDTVGVVKRVELSVASGSRSIRLPDNIVVRQVLTVERDSRAPQLDERSQPVHPHDWRHGRDIYELGDNYVFLSDGIDQPTTFRIRYLTEYDVSLATWSDSVDLTGTVGLSEGLACDVLVVGTTWRLLMGQEARRLQNEAQGSSRDPQEVPAQSNVRLGQFLKGIRDERLANEVARINRRGGRAA